MPRKSEAPLSGGTAAALADLDAMWRQVDAARERLDLAVVPRPAASFTAREYAQRHGLSEATAQGHCERMIEAGLARRIRCIVASANGRATPTNVYVPATTDVESA